MKKRFQLSLLIICGLSAAGCVDKLNKKYTTSARKSLGIVYILPDIKGVDDHYKKIRQGLIGSSINCAVMIHPWSRKIPGEKLLIKKRTVQGDREWGRAIAKDIMKYQKKYPSRPVYIIGQSAGCGVAVFCAEALSEMPKAKPLRGIVLLNGSLSADYDLTRALSMTRQGIVNFYNPKGVALMKFGTTVKKGQASSGHVDSVGRVGFDRRYEKLFQIEILKDMVDDFAPPRFADFSKAFTSQYIAPWIIDRTWPPMHITTTR